MKLKPGMRLRSQVDETEIIIVRLGSTEPAVACGGHPMIDVHATPQPGLVPASAPGGGTQLGKRYTGGTDSSLELLVTKPGSGDLTVDGEPARMKAAKPLPASD
jgi:hypothetical protein